MSPARDVQAAAEQCLCLLAAAGGQNFDLHAQRFGQLLNGDIIEKDVLLLTKHDGRNAQRSARQLALALVDDIRRGHKPSDADVSAEEIVLDGMHGDLDHRVLAVQLRHHLLNERCCHRAGDDIEFLAAINAVRLFQLIEEFALIEPHHADAVFQLVEVLVELRRWDGPLRLEIPFIAGIDDPLAVPFLALVAELFHDVDDCRTRLLIKGDLRIQVLAVVGHAAGNGGDALHHRGEFQQVGQRPAKLVAVVDAAAKNQLTVDRDAALDQPGQVLEDFAAPSVRQHPDTKLWVGGVDGNVDGRNVHLDDAVDLVVLHVRHGDVVAEQEAQTLIIIFKVQALSHSRRELVDKAEHAVVGAGMFLVAQIGREVAAERPTRFPVDIPLPDAVGDLRFQMKALAVGIEIVVQRVVQLVFINAQQLIARHKAKGFGLTAGLDAFDFDTQAFTFFLFSDRTRRGRRAPSPSVHNTNYATNSAQIRPS